MPNPRRARRYEPPDRPTTAAKVGMVLLVLTPYFIAAVDLVKAFWAPK
jgi:hypothetical protein